MELSKPAVPSSAFDIMAVTEPEPLQTQTGKDVQCPLARETQAVLGLGGVQVRRHGTAHEGQQHSFAVGPGQEPQAQGIEQTQELTPAHPSQGGASPGPCWQHPPDWDLWASFGHVKDHIKCNKCRSRS